MADYTQMDMAALEQAQHQNMAARAKLKDEARAIQAAMDATQAASKAEQTLNQASPAERHAMQQLLAASGIQSSGAMGNPGG